VAEEAGQDRTERASPKRLDEARKRGQVPRSPELNAAVVTLMTAGVLYGLGGTLSADLYDMMRDALTISRSEIADERAAPLVFGTFLWRGMLIVAPVLVLTFIAAFVAPMTLGGWNFSTEALGFKFERINPAAGIARMFSIRSLVEVGKALLKFGLVGSVAALVLWNQSGAFLGLSQEPVQQAIGHALTMCGEALLAMAAALALIAAIDVPYQLWQHQKDLRMTRQELQDESKETEGSPETKGRVRAMQQEFARRRMMQAVPGASVVITNPEHYAVALRYEDGRTRAPILVAKGADEVAAKIREIARENNVPIFEAPPLARTIFRNVDIGVEIPAELYVAVAQVLTYVVQLQAAMQTGVEPPPRPAIDPAVEQLGGRRRH